MTAFCPNCKTWVPVIDLDDGIGAHEYQGHVAVDRRIVFVCANCESSNLYDDEDLQKEARFD